jgi:hypothetical protein
MLLRLPLTLLILSCLCGRIQAIEPPAELLYPDPCSTKLIEVAKQFFGFGGGVDQMVLSQKLPVFQRAVRRVARYILAQSDELKAIDWDQFFSGLPVLDTVWINEREGVVLNNADVWGSIADSQKLQKIVDWGVEKQLNLALSGEYFTDAYRANFLAGSPAKGVVLVAPCENELGRTVATALKERPSLQGMPRLMFADVEGRIFERQLLEQISAVQYTGVPLTDLSSKRLAIEIDLAPSLPEWRYAVLNTNRIIVTGKRYVGELDDWLKMALDGLDRSGLHRSVEVQFPLSLNKLELRWQKRDREAFLRIASEMGAQLIQVPNADTTSYYSPFQLKRGDFEVNFTFSEISMVP